MLGVLDRDFAGKEPLSVLESWLLEAEVRELNDPNAVSLATVGLDGFPSVRMVLVKGMDSDSVHFYTNLSSRKARELGESGKAAMCFHWKSLRRQVRLVGRVERLSDSVADAYYASRGYMSRIGAWASEQSRPLASREVLEERVAFYRRQYPEERGDSQKDNISPPRPPHWGGFRLVPHEVEFWLDGEARLHDRFEYRLMGGAWSCRRLYP